MEAHPRRQYSSRIRVSEAQFRDAVRDIIGELGKFRLGGEQSDLWTTRIRCAGKRRTAAFLVKGTSDDRQADTRENGKER